MSLLDPLHPIQSSTIELLARAPGLKAQELHQRLREEFALEVSLTNLYRSLAQLLEAQVLVRNKGRHSLNLTWVTHLLRLSEAIAENYLTSERTEVEIPKRERDVKRFYSDSLLGLDGVWNDALLQLMNFTEERNWYAYNSHPWYSLGMPDTERRFYQALVSAGISAHMLYGNKGFLDEYAERVFRVEGFRTCLSENTGFPEEGYALWVCGEYLLECEMPPAISSHFAFYFNSVTAVDVFDPQLFADIFKMRSRCSISIRRALTRAEELREKLVHYFS